MKKINFSDLMSYKPCYDPKKYLHTAWEGNAIDLLNVVACPLSDRMCIILREELVSKKNLLLFAVHTVDDVLSLDTSSSFQSFEACRLVIAEAYGLKVTQGEKTYARRQAQYAAREASLSVISKLKSGHQKPFRAAYSARAARNLVDNMDDPRKAALSSYLSAVSLDLPSILTNCENRLRRLIVEEERTL